jgi:cell division protein FtsW (lipid II flippase)
MIVYREPPSRDLRSRIPFLVFLICLVGLLGYFASAPAWESNLHPSIGMLDWLKRAAAWAIVFLVVLAPLLIAAVMGGTRDRHTRRPSR